MYTTDITDIKLLLESLLFQQAKLDKSIDRFMSVHKELEDEWSSIRAGAAVEVMNEREELKADVETMIEQCEDSLVDIVFYESNKDHEDWRKMVTMFVTTIVISLRNAGEDNAVDIVERTISGIFQETEKIKREQQRS